MASAPEVPVGRLHRGERLVLASHNPGKLAELADLVRPHGAIAVSAAELGLPEPAETGESFVENARIKAVAAARGSGLPALADDSGFCVAALGGAPGIHSARWAEAQAGQARDFAAAMARVHSEMGDAADRRAWFMCALCVAWPDDATATFVGRVDGEAIWPPRGHRGFGYDPMFVPVGLTQTFGEVKPAQKHVYSHRARAFAQMMAACLG
jgi:XTP/dITP diphosphohydrolase